MVLVLLLVVGMMMTMSSALVVMASVEVEATIDAISIPPRSVLLPSHVSTETEISVCILFAQSFFKRIRPGLAHKKNVMIVSFDRCMMPWNKR